MEQPHDGVSLTLVGMSLNLSLSFQAQCLRGVEQRFHLIGIRPLNKNVQPEFFHAATWVVCSFGLVVKALHQGFCVVMLATLLIGLPTKPFYRLLTDASFLFNRIFILCRVTGVMPDIDSHPGCLFGILLSHRREIIDSEIRPFLRFEM